jgi:hypothetical protein
MVGEIGEVGEIAGLIMSSFVCQSFLEEFFGVAAFAHVFGLEGLNQFLLKVSGLVTEGNH